MRQIHVIDGTYELFRHYFGAPPAQDEEGNEVAALRGVLASVLSLLEEGATHLGVATDHVIESFRNELWPGYKTAAGIEPALLSQFHPLEDALRDLGVIVWPMTGFEADDAMASAAALAASDRDVDRVLLCTPDKDLGQCVSGDRVVQWDRRRDVIRNEQGVVEKFGVPPASVPDYLALVGDSADGFPGIQGWGPKSAAAVLSRYRRLEEIPRDWGLWGEEVRGAKRLAQRLFGDWDKALLFRDLATLRADLPLFESVEELRWVGPTTRFEELCRRLRVPALARRASAVLEGRG